MIEENRERTFSDIIHQTLEGEKAASLAEKIGVNPSIFSRWRNGKMFPGARYHPKISEHLGVTMEELSLLNLRFHRERGRTRYMRVPAENLETTYITMEDLAFLQDVLAGTNGKLRLDIAIELLIARNS